MLLQLRKCGKQTVCGDDSRNYDSASPPVNTLAFKAATAEIGDDSTMANDTKIGFTMPLHTENVC